MTAPVILPYRGVLPTIDASAFVAPNTSVIGDVRVGPESSVWFGTTLRGDVQPIVIGARTSIQDNSVIHATDGWTPTIVGDDCVVGHRVILHGCKLGHRVLVGMGAIVMDGVEVGDDVLIGAGAILTPRTKVPSGTMVLGAPGKVRRDLTEEERASILAGAKHYVAKTHEYRAIVAG